MKHDMKPRGLVKHSVDLNDDEICEAVRYWLLHAHGIVVPETAYVNFDADYCCLSGVLIDWETETDS